MNIGFFIRHFLERGTEVAIYDYAKNNEEILNNKSFIICFTEETQKNIGLPLERFSYDKFKSRFLIIEINNINEMKNIIEKYNLLFFYTQTYGGSNDIYQFENKNIWGKCKTIKHCVFDTTYPESDFYISISETLNDKNKTTIPVIPYIVSKLPNCNENLRCELNIPQDAIVFGRHGGRDEFNILITHLAIIEFLNLNLNTYFLFMNTNKFYEHPRIIYLERNLDLEYKVKFINTCDAMIHARKDGETFGLAIAEFSAKNKPVITCSCGDLEHIKILKNKAILYESKEDLLNIFRNINIIIKSRNDWNAYEYYTPINIMNLFKKYIFDKYNIDKENIENIENNVKLVENLNCFALPVSSELSTKKNNFNCYICGCVLNCEKYLNNVFNNILKIGKLFNNYKVIVAYDNSNDESLNILLEYQKIYDNIEIIINKNEKSIYKTENIKNARNSILNFIKNDVNNELYDFFIMMDLDDVCEKEINVNILEKYLYNNEWDSLSFNKYDYYDIWALSIEPYVTSCWHWSIKQNDSLYVKNIMENYIKNKLKSINENELLECYSAFNGFAIYRIEKFINCVYNNNIFNSLGKIPINLIQNNIDKLNDISGKNNSIYISFLEDCEHRSFHLDAMFNYGARNRISPLYLFDDSSEVNCKYVSSRGILKSCTIKSATPISSINQLINYDFTKLIDGISIYVCNYALSHFIEIFDQIKCKIILVSGDSDCLVPYEIFKNHESFLSFIESEKIIHWYTQNCVIDHPKISKIPIGMDYHTINEKDSDWGKKISPIMQEKILENIKSNSLPFYQRKIKCYANFHFSMETKYGFDRKDALQNINKDLVFYEYEKIDSESTWKKQCIYAFIIMPFENGLDSYKIWEALILGCIPIMKRSGLYELFNDLPVLIVENWTDINNELLINTVNNFKDKVFNYDKLLLSYWNNKINNNIKLENLEYNIKILIAHYNEDLIWTKNLKYNYTIISKNGIKYETIPNKGNEASSYLQYIIENYNNLANYTFFIHGHRNSWHHKENIDEKINNIIIKHDYYNLNDQNITTTFELSQREHNEYKIIIQLIPILENILNKKIDFEKIKYRSCAQFYVSEKNILLNDINVYKKLYEFIMNTNISSYFTSRLFEYTWHFIFTHNLEDIE
jgi:hypothetical protein